MNSVACSAALSITFASSLCGQASTPSRVPDAVTCSACRILFRTTAVLPTASGPRPLVGFPTTVRVDSQQRYWVLGDGSPHVFDVKGNSLPFKREISPRDFGFPTDAIAVAGDSVIVVDAANNLVTVIDSALRIVRTIGLSFSVESGIALQWPDRMLLNGHVGTSEAAGFPLHEVSFAAPNAVLVSSFGPDDGRLLVGGTSSMRGSIRSDGLDGFWAADVSRYRLTRWSLARLATDSMIREPTWFPGTPLPTLGGTNRSPSPLIVAVEPDSAGRLWVFIRVPARTWRSAWPEPTAGLSEVPITVDLITKLYDTMIEVVNPADRRVVTRFLLNDVVLASLPGVRAVVYAKDGTGAGQLKVVEFTLALKGGNNSNREKK